MKFMMMRLLLLISLIVSISCDLQIHNRARQEAVVYPMLRWSSKLEASARRIAEYSCKRGLWQHSKPGSCEYCRGSGVGENLAGHGNMKDAVNAFLDEKQYWLGAGYGCQSGKTCGHYTEMIHRSYAKLGCYTIPYSRSVTSPCARTVCHYAGKDSSYAFETDQSPLECGDDHYDGDLCLYPHEDETKTMRFTESQLNGCDMDENVYKHTDKAYNNYYLHFVPERMDVVTNETLSRRWLVSRDYVSESAHFWCDSPDLMQCDGKWYRNVFDDIGVSQEIDIEITIRKCAALNDDDDAMSAEGTNAIIIAAVIIVLVIVGVSLYLFTRSRSRQKNSLKRMEVIADHEKEEEEELDVTIPVITN